jgi:hypothetical protein
LSNNPENLEEYPEPDANDVEFREHLIFKLSDDPRWSIPKEVEGFKCLDGELMSKIWPEGTEKALQASTSCRFLSLRLNLDRRSSTSSYTARRDRNI